MLSVGTILLLWSVAAVRIKRVLLVEFAQEIVKVAKVAFP